MQTTVAMWGNSLALRLPKHVAADARLYEGTAVDLKVEGDTLFVRPARPRYRLADLLAQVTPANLPNREEVDWGEPAGEEQW
jgi:antitoxin MazE